MQHLFISIYSPYICSFTVYKIHMKYSTKTEDIHGGQGLFQRVDGVATILVMLMMHICMKDPIQNISHPPS